MLEPATRLAGGRRAEGAPAKSMPSQVDALAGGRRSPSRASLFPFRASPCPSRGPAQSRCLRLRGAFTLLEILVVIALIAMITAALITGTARLLQHKTPSSAEFFWKAVDGARRQAMMANCDVRLSFDSKNRLFVADSIQGEQVYPFAPDLPMDVSFTASTSDSGGGSQTKSLPFVTFYGDGTCSPFAVQFSGKGVDGVTVEIDPWTCAPILRAAPSS